MPCNCTAIGLSSALKMNQWFGSGAAQPMAAKLARMGRASRYIVRAFPQGSSDFFSFSDDYKSFALRDSRPSLLNKPSQRIQTSLCSADSPFLSSPQRLLQLVHSDSLFRKLLYKIANFFGVFANAVPFLSLVQGSPACRWQTRRVCFMLGRHPHWNSTHGTECHYCGDMNLSSPRSWLAFFQRKTLPLAPSRFFLPGTCDEKAVGQRISALEDEWGYSGCTPVYLTHR